MSQPVIKIVLLVAVVAFGFLAFRGSTQASYRLLWRGYGVLVAVVAALSIAFPDGLTEVAHSVGVGRGADLLLYVLVVTFMLVTVTLFRRLAEVERRYVQLVRTLAVQEAARADLAAHPELLDPELTRDDG